MKRFSISILFLYCTTVLLAQPDNAAIRSCANADLAPFYHGVASGDPTSSSVIIWTRVTPEVDEPVNIGWIVSTNMDFTDTIAMGNIITNADRDYTVKVDVEGLSPGSYYYYEFSAFEKVSLTGRTKTAPVGNVDQLRFAVVSCSNYPVGYFNVYEKIYERNDIDAVIHLGDYIYEGGGSSVLQEEMPRQAPPANELVQLADYRIRHGAHKLDSDSRKMHQNFPLIAVWDDHESDNNSWRDGAPDHNPATQGSWNDRKNASLQAYYEWMPIRLPEENNFYRIFRKFNYGDLADIYMLDTRLYDRDEHVSNQHFGDTSRSLIGPEQMAWLQTEMINSTAQYQIIGQQVVMTQLGIPNYLSQEFIPLNPDQWDGYEAERTRLYNFILEADIDNFVVLTGDVHTGWANDLPYDIFNYVPYIGTGSVGVEFVSTSVTSSSVPFAFPFGESVLKQVLPYIRYVNLSRKGYNIIDLNSDRVQGDFYTINSVETPTTNEVFEEGWYAEDGDSHLQKASDASIDERPVQALAPCNPRGQEDTTITALQVNQFDVLGVYPNPFINDILLEVHLFENAEVSLEVIDMKSASMAKKSFGILHYGRNLITINDLELSNGTYDLILNVGGQRLSRKVVRLE